MMNQTTDKMVSFEDGQVVLNYIFLCILFIAILVNNSLVLTASWSQKRLHSQLNVIVLSSMALAQMIGGLMSIPINMALVQDYEEDPRLDFSVVVATFSGVASQLLLSIVCVERYLIVAKPVVHGKLKRGYVIISCVIVWFLSLLAALLSLVDFKNYSIFLVTVFFILPFLVEVFGYVLLYCCSKGRTQTTLLRKELRLAKWFAIFTFIFNVLWLPFIVTILLRDHCESCDTERGSLFLFILYFQLLSDAISAMIYYRASLDFRLAYKIVFSELRNMICRGANSDNPQDVAMHDGTIRRDAKENHVNEAMYWNEEASRNARHNDSSLRHSRTADPSSKADHEDVHIVPYEQTKYFSGNFGAEEDIQGVDGDNDGVLTLDDEFGFHDIDIIPYDQSC
ncbi:sphingosine 1-phosphate receptor 2-like [Dendronephthya gigantea]|uniref:sphingosine 1-phosphate receptor 2-like n=1 Tax=Dendronephthya gigantea TaxID=151771 RepID=UPI001069031A|nr:sphingosine 1-phosphate receptor 2-like [Dendronephthya gigantea]XP_028403210.1 sphingosine 1-phosphate receptor 2-like [Dendronephthya gigantea]